MSDRYGIVVSAARRTTGRTLREVASHMGVSISYVHDIERGHRLPFDTTRTLKLAKYLGLDAFNLAALAAAERGTVEVPADNPVRVRRAIALVFHPGAPAGLDDEPAPPLRPHDAAKPAGTSSSPWRQQRHVIPKGHRA